MSTDIKDKIDIAFRFHQGGEFEKAEELYREVLSESPENSDALNLLGLLKLQNKQFNDAVFYIQKALELNPCVYFFENLGRAHLGNKDFVRAIECFKVVAKLKPDDFDILFNLALSYKNDKQFDEAINIYEAALLIKPDNADVYFNLGNVYENMDDTKMALKYYQKALENNVQDDKIDYFLAVSYLKLKDFENGWKYYELRPSKEFGIASQALCYENLLSKPFYQGEEALDKTLFVYYEAALGDSIMYARYMLLLAEKFKKVLFKPQYSLVELFRNSDLGAEVIDSSCTEIEFDVHLPLMGVPYALGLNSEAQIPLAEGFLKSDPAKVKEYKEKYFDNDKLKIGIKWQGNPAYDKQRIIPLEAFYKLFELPNTQFYSIQKDDGSEELKNLPSKYNVIDLGPTFNDFTDTAAAIENFDLVICNDTSLAHLAGALGKACYILLPYVSNWRWHDDFSYSPWYKSVKLFKQTTPDDWSDVFEKVFESIIKP